MDTTDLTRFRRLPKFIQRLLIFISIITIVYWIGYLFYITLEGVRKVFYVISYSKKGYWLFITCILTSCLVCLLFAQFYFDLNPIGKVTDYFNQQYDKFIKMLVDALT